MDEFRKYFQDNRNRLDSEEFPLDEGWADLEGKLHVQKSKVKLFHWGIAASFLLLISVSFYAIYQSNTILNESRNEPTTKGIPLLTDSLGKRPETNLEIASFNEPTMTRNKGPKRIQKNTKKQVTQLPTELEQMDMSFQAVINAQLKSIRTIPFYAESPDYFSFFKKEYAILEKDESTLKMEVRQYGMNENSLDKLINIYKGKLSLLKKLQAEIQQMNNRIRQSDPDLSNRKPVYINI